MSVAAPTTHADLALEGMTCASCAARIERKLNRLDSVHASVNFGTDAERDEPGGGARDRHRRTDVAIEASDLTLVSGDLRAASDVIRLARRTLQTIRGNLFWAFAYNVAAIPLAIAGVLNPIIAAAAMAFSSVFVVSNSLRLRRFRSPRQGEPA